MDFWEFKKKALSIKNNLVEAWAKKIANSNMVINKIDNLEEFIKKSETKVFTSKETWETKEFIKKVIIIFAKKDSDFFKNFLIWLPVLVTKAFSQNIPLKVCDIDLKDLSEYNIKSQPSLLIFETENVIKTIEWEEKILKITKDLNLDLEKSIENV